MAFSELTISAFHFFLSGEDTRFHLGFSHIYGWRWSIALWILAFHTIISVIIAEVMGRSYGKPWLWFIVAFFIPVIGPIAILLYHALLASSSADARKQTFWEKVLFSRPVSLRKAIFREQARAGEVQLIDYGGKIKSREVTESNNEIEDLIKTGRYADARGVAWKLMEIAIDSGDKPGTARYQEYLEVIAQRESLSSGDDI